MKHIRHLIILQKKNAEGGSVETVSSAVITALYNMSKDELLVYNSTDLKGDLHCAVGSSKLINSLMAQYPGLSIEADTYTIDFEDAEFERICIANWGSDGVVTASALAAVTSIGQTFKNNTNIISGDDLVYFTGVTGNGGNMDISGCTNMTSITLPPRMTEMPAVANNPSLTTVNGLDHILRVMYSKFSNCTSLLSLVFTGLTGDCNIGENLLSLTTLEINEGCTSLNLTGNNSVMTSLYVLASVTNINVRRFLGLTTITFAPNSQLASTSSYGGFGGCSALTTLVNFPWDTWTDMGSYCFSGCTSLTGTVKSPIGQTTINNFAFDSMKSIDTIIIDAAVTTFGQNCFRYVRTGAKIIMNPTTPPTLSETVPGEAYGRPNTTGCVFYVPDASYNDYISNGGQYWTELYNNGRIKKMSELPS